MSNTFSVKDKVVICTGAFGLLGMHICKTYLAEGAYVIVAGRNPEQVPEIEKDFKKVYPPEKFLVCTMDITQQESVDSCLDIAVKRFGQIDILINNAAIDAKYQNDRLCDVNSIPFEDYPFDLIQKSVEVNTLGTMRVTQSVCKYMVKQNAGNILNIGSIYSVIAPNPKLYQSGDEVKYKPIDYVASKSFIPNFTRYLAVNYAKSNIRCNTIAPHGIFDNHDDAFVTNFSDLSPMGRMCEKKDLEGALLFLTSSASEYITGITLVVDGGWTSI